MKYLFFYIFIICTYISYGQDHFKARAEIEGQHVVFYIQIDNGAADINTGWSDIEFFLRHPDTQDGIITFGAITINTDDFPGIVITNNGANVQGSETGYTNYWFGNSFTATAARDYVSGVAYEVFRIDVEGDLNAVDLELVHNEGFFPHYLALTTDRGTDLTNTGIKFYGDNVRQCSDCPGSSLNDVQSLSSNVLPATLLHFSVAYDELNNVLCSWQTASEINTDKFIIERSFDGTSFTEIGHVKAAGQSLSSIKYTFTDRDLSFRSNGDKVYYRLKTVDFDGSFVHSGMRSLTINREENFHVWPNPAEPGHKIFIRGIESDDKVFLVHPVGIKSKLTLDNGQVRLPEHITSGAYKIIISEKKLSASLIIL